MTMPLAWFSFAAKARIVTREYLLPNRVRLADVPNWRENDFDKTQRMTTLHDLVTNQLEEMHRALSAIERGDGDPQIIAQQTLERIHAKA